MTPYGRQLTNDWDGLDRRVRRHLDTTLSDTDDARLTRQCPGGGDSRRLQARPVCGNALIRTRKWAKAIDGPLRVPEGARQIFVRWPSLGDAMLCDEEGGAS